MLSAKELLTVIDYEIVCGEIRDVVIKGLKYDSRLVGIGDMFFCRKGEHTNGHNYIDQVIEKGATVIVVEDEVSITNNEVLIIKVKNSDKALSKIAAKFYNYPSRKLDVIGVTGTNGKTSISYLITEMLIKTGRSVGVIGTIGMVLNGEKVEIDTTMPTTPDSLELQNVLATMQNSGAQHVVMEVSSIALDQSRVADCEISTGIFTNLTVDHLDYHKTMENYREAKYKLFKKTALNVINIDDETGEMYVERLESNYPDKKIITYSSKDKRATYYISEIEIQPGKTDFKLTIDQTMDIKLTTQLTGRFNVYNLVAAIAVVREKGVSFDSIKNSLKEIKGARGRFETLSSDRGVNVIVDYAHSPDALEKVLETINEFKNTGTKKITTVFGCGGDRDKTKRPQMGLISGKLSDKTIVTSDNPRSENPIDILKQIEGGIVNIGASYEIIEEREEAIKKAITQAKCGDVVLIAGKGHETYQIIKDKTIHFDDIEIAKKYL